MISLNYETNWLMPVVETPQAL